MDKTVRKYLLAPLCTAWLAAGPLIAFAQNPCSLLKNGNFESQVNGAGPTRLNNMNGGTSTSTSAFGTPIPSEVVAWESATVATPDYYARNASGINGGDVHPDTGWLAQFIPFDPAGNNNPPPPAGSVGVGTVLPYFYNPNRVSEYVTQTLPGQLTEGRYYAQFRVRPGDRPRNSNVNDNPSTRGVNGGFGLVFSDGPLTRNTIDFLTPPSGSKTVFNTTPINDASIWQLVGQQFTVDAGEVIKTVTAGLFDPDPNNMVNLINTAQPNVSYTYRRTYFLLDEVELFRVPTAGPSIFCNNTHSPTVQLGEGCPIPGATYAWYEEFSTAPTGPVVATTLKWSAPRTRSAFYTLVVTLPDGSTSVSSVYVEACPCGASPEALPLCVATGSPVTLTTSNAPCDGDTFSWNGPWGTGRFTSNQLNPTLTVAEVDDPNNWGDYELTVTHADGSTTTSSTTLFPLSISAKLTYYETPVPEYGQVCRFAHVTFRAAGDWTRLSWTVINERANGSDWQNARVTPAPRDEWTIIVNSPNGGPQTLYEVQCTMQCPNGQTVSKVFPFYSVPRTASCPAKLRAAPDKEPVAAAYPNPVDDALRLPEGVTNVTLLNSQGRAVQRPDGTGKLDVRSLPAGLYNLQMQQDGKLINQHIEVKH